MGLSSIPSFSRFYRISFTALITEFFETVLATLSRYFLCGRRELAKSGKYKAKLGLFFALNQRCLELNSGQLGTFSTQHTFLVFKSFFYPAKSFY